MHLMSASNINYASNIAKRTQIDVVHYEATTNKTMQYLMLFFATLTLVSTSKPKVTDKVFFDIEIEGEKVGRIEIGLFRRIVPKTVKNFVELCKRPYGKGYKGCNFEYINRKFMQSGNFSDNDGSQDLSIYGKLFANENYKLKHYGAGWLSMVSHNVAHSNVSFFIMMVKNKDFDGRCVVFGKILKGMDVLHTMMKVGSDPKSSKAYKNVVIADCNAEVVQKPFAVEKAESTD